MAFAAVAGIASAAAAAAAQIGAAGFFATLFSTAGLTAFAIGAGLSMVSRALISTPSLGQQMAGLEFSVREPDATRKMIYGRTRVGGSIVFIDTTDGDEDNEYIHMVIAFAGHEVDAFEEIYANQERIWNNGIRTVSWQPYLDVNVHLGNQTAADAELVSRSSKWTTDHKLLDTAYVYIRLKYDAEFFANGLPNISATIRGKKVLNPVTSVTEWTQNPALCVYDYLRDTKYGLAESASDINLAALATAISLCDQNVDLAAGGSQARYTLDGLIDSANSKKENIEAMLSSMAGKLVYSSGEYFISGGAYVAPSVTIDESVMVGGIEVQTKQSRRGLYNGVKGVFRSEEDDYNVADYPAQSSSTFSTADGEPIYLDMALPFTTNNIRAQRIAKLALLQSRQQTTITVPCNLTALKFRAGDTVMITNAKMGWSQKVFQVIGYDLSLSSSGEIVVNVQAIETAAGIYDWTSSDEEDYLTGGELDLYDGKTAQPPVGPLGLSASSTVNADGTVTPTINVSWTAASDSFTDYYLVQWYNSTTGSTAVNSSTKTTAFTIGPVEPASNYVVTVYAYNGLGVKSIPLTGNVATITDTTPKLPSIYQIDTDSTVEPTASQFTTAAGRGPKEGDIVIGTDTTVTPNKTYAWSYNLSSTDWTSNSNFISGDLIVDGSITAVGLAANSVTADKITADAITTDKIAAGAVTADEIAAGTITATEIAADTITASQIAANTLTAEEIQVSSITVDRLTGDVTEVYPIEWPINASYGAGTLTNFQEFSIPEPKLGIVKRQKVELQLELFIENTTSSDAYYGYVAGVQMKSKSATGTAVGTVTYVSAPSGSTSIWSFVGNVIENIDTRGSVADSANGSNGTAFIDGVRYDATADKTYIQIDSSSSFFTTGDTAYYSPSSFSSVGTWTNQGVFNLQYVEVNANSRVTLTLDFIKSFGQSSTATDLRLFVFSGMAYRAIEYRGTMENIS